MPRRKALAAAALIALLAAAPHHSTARVGSFKLAIPSGPFVGGSRLAIDTAGVFAPVALSAIGPGTMNGSTLQLPAVAEPAETTVIGAAPGALAYASVRIVPAPQAHRAMLAVATYENGIALHDPKTFALIGYAPIGGPPGDVAFDAAGSLYAPDTDGNTLTRFARSPWRLQDSAGVATGNEVAVDPRTGNVFVSDRDVNGKGALTRVSRNGGVRRVLTGDTAEGLAIDERRGLVYVGNVNDNSVAEVDARSMRIRRKIRSVQRTFGIALDAASRRLFVVSNTSPGMHAGGGFVAAIDLSRRHAPIVARSGPMTFPIGVAFDAKQGRLFVTDEAADVVYVLNARTLRRIHKPLSTCETPWRPRIAAGRLYVPCARANRVDVFDLTSLRRVAGAPFATGGFPLSVAVWP